MLPHAKALLCRYTEKESGYTQSEYMSDKNHMHIMHNDHITTRAGRYTGI